MPPSIDIASLAEIIGEGNSLWRLGGEIQLQFAQEQFEFRFRLGVAVNTKKAMKTWASIRASSW
jgi:hypothetical protein